jgi:hypothetical protein
MHSSGCHIDPGIQALVGHCKTACVKVRESHTGFEGLVVDCEVRRRHIVTRGDVNSEIYLKASRCFQGGKPEV